MTRETINEKEKKDTEAKYKILYQKINPGPGEIVQRSGVHVLNMKSWSYATEKMPCMFLEVLHIAKCDSHGSKIASLGPRIEPSNWVVKYCQEGLPGPLSTT